VTGTGGPAVFDVSGGTVHGLAVNGTADAGIVLRGGWAYANRIGTDRLGLRTEGRFGVGVSVQDDSAEVGSPVPGEWNVIATPAVAVRDGGYGSISGNFIGVAAGGGALLETNDPPGFGIEVC